MAEIVYTLQSKQDRYPVLRRNSGGYGLAYGIFMTVFSLGCVSASAGSPPMLGLKNGWNMVMYSLAGICLITSFPIALWTGRKSPGGRCGMRKPRDVELEAISL
ncbi:hypothetical protein BGZ63DRAFT_423859 [Mariannaea sp. PMI_226]|nr:hypothetical protein BGZ63DRAFT_423859 [Mariannaea sp. PMI_226]